MKYAWKGLRYASNLTDAEWLLLSCFLLAALNSSAVFLHVKPHRFVAREAAGQEASPTAGIIDSQSVKTTQMGGPRGFDSGKKIKGRKRHIIVDTQGLLVGLVVHSTDIQDRDGAVAVLAFIHHLYPWLRHIFADGGYAGNKLANALKNIGKWTVEIVRRSGPAKGFELLPRRWVVERTLACLEMDKRLAKDFERSIQSAEAWTLIANIRSITRKIATH